MTEEQIEVNRRRLTIFENGFRPVAIKRGEKNPYEKEWPTLARLDPPACIKYAAYGFSDAAGRFHRPGLYPNTGILGDGLRAIDIDIDGDLAYDVGVWCLQHLGAAPIRYRLNATRMLLPYLAKDGEPPKRQINDGNPDKELRKAVEVLGKGNQFFGYGTHPSGAKLKWCNDIGPHNLRRNCLTPIDEDQVEALLRYVAELLCVEYDPPRECSAPPQTRQTDDMSFFNDSNGGMTINDVRAYLTRIDNPAGYDDWFYIGAAVHHATGGSDEGYRAWYDWSDDPTECHQSWTSMSRVRKSGGYGAGTLVHLAKQNDRYFRPPSKTIGKLKLFT